ncbi:MAG: CoA transferase [Chloroflexi bacterium]|nr:CoA transferase [Chloroflexota bacterium]
MPKLPLEGIRIIEASDALALPHGMHALGDLGAEVIQVEHCGRVNFFRLSAPFPENEAGESFWNRAGSFNQWNRNKMSLTLDLNAEQGKAIFKRLVAISDVVAENFTARVMKNFGLDYPVLREIKQDLIMLSNTGYGHTGPWRNYVGMAQVVEAATTASMTGYPDGGPTKAAQSPMDLVASWNMAAAVVMALLHRQRTGKGQWIDHSMLQAGVPTIAEAFMDAVMNQRNRHRMGNRDPYFVPQGCYPCKGDDEWVVISVTNDADWEHLCRAMERPELIEDPRFATVLDRHRNHDELDRLLSAWTRGRDKYEVMHTLQRAGVAAGALLSTKGLLLDPHLKARRFFEKLTHVPESGVGTRPYATRPYKFSATPPRIRFATPPLGYHNEYVLVNLLGMDAEQVREMEAEHVIGRAAWETEKENGKTVYRRPTFRTPPQPLEEMKAKGNIQDYDPNYKEILGI